MVRVYERDYDGNIDKQLDDFIMEHFGALKQEIRGAFRR